LAASRAVLALLIQIYNFILDLLWQNWNRSHHNAY